MRKGGRERLEKQKKKTIEERKMKEASRKERMKKRKMREARRNVD